MLFIYYISERPAKRRWTVALYVCMRCGGRDAYCMICWGNRYYTPTENVGEVPTQRTESPEESTLEPTSEDPNEVESPDVNI